MSDGQAIVLAVVLLGLNAFFVGAEFALISARRTQIEPRVAEGSRIARTTLFAMEHVSLMMAGAQLGITVCSLGLGALGEPAVAHTIEPWLGSTGIPEGLLHPIAFTIAMTLVVFLHVVIGEMVPKNISLATPERAALVLGPPLVLIVTVLRPFVAGLNAVANAVLRMLRVTPQEEVSSTFTREQVAGLIEESRREGMLDDDAYDLLAAALGFQERTVARVVIPLTDLVTVDRGATVADVEARCAATGYSRFPVLGEAGELAGYLHLKDALQADPQARSRTLDAAWIRPLAVLAADDLLHDALRVMQSLGAHMARIAPAEGADDGRGPGIVMLEDVLEELVGEIRDATQHAYPARPP